MSMTSRALRTLASLRLTLFLSISLIAASVVGVNYLLRGLHSYAS